MESRGDPQLGCLPRWVMEPRPAQRTPAPWAAATGGGGSSSAPAAPCGCCRRRRSLPVWGSTKGPALRATTGRHGSERLPAQTAACSSSLRCPSCLLPEGWQPCTTWVSTFTLPQASHVRAPARNNDPEDQQQTPLEHRKHKTESSSGDVNRVTPLSAQKRGLGCADRP